MERRMKVKEWRIENDLEDNEQFQEYLQELVCDSVCPAMCTCGADVEPDGHCEHGNPSILIALGMI